MAPEAGRAPVLWGQQRLRAPCAIAGPAREHQGLLALLLPLCGPHVTTEGTLSQRPEDRRRLRGAGEPRRDGGVRAACHSGSLRPPFPAPGPDVQTAAKPAASRHRFANRQAQTPLPGGTGPLPASRNPEGRSPRNTAGWASASTRPRGVPGPSSRAEPTAATLSLGTAVRPPVTPEGTQHTPGTRTRDSVTSAGAAGGVRWQPSSGPAVGTAAGWRPPLPAPHRAHLATSRKRRRLLGGESKWPASAVPRCRATDRGLQGTWGGGRAQAASCPKVMEPG